MTESEWAAKVAELEETIAHNADTIRILAWDQTIKYRALEIAREALDEMKKPPYKDSDLESLFEWVNARAAHALIAIEEVLK